MALGVTSEAVPDVVGKQDQRQPPIGDQGWCRSNRRRPPSFFARHADALAVSIADPPPNPTTISMPPDARTVRQASTVSSDGSPEDVVENVDGEGRRSAWLLQPHLAFQSSAFLCPLREARGFLQETALSLGEVIESQCRKLPRRRFRNVLIAMITPSISHCAVYGSMRVDRLLGSHRVAIPAYRNSSVWAISDISRF